MTLSLAPVEAPRFPAWRARCHREYAADLIRAGEQPQAADRQADDALDRAFPGGVPTANHAVFDLLDDAEGVVGYLWIGPDRSGDDASWWVWDVVVDAEYRGRGFGRKAMRLAEEHARAAGARTFGLSVFGHNTAARRLYESVGYETTSVKMRKSL